jgi:hypothetical protein
MLAVDAPPLADRGGEGGGVAARFLLLPRVTTIYCIDELNTRWP